MFNFQIENMICVINFVFTPRCGYCIPDPLLTALLL